jgi:hypothetical protein
MMIVTVYLDLELWMPAFNSQYQYVPPCQLHVHSNLTEEKMKNVTSPIHKTEFQNQNVTLLRTVNSIYHLNCSSYAIISCTYLKEIPICWILLLKLKNITHSIIFTYYSELTTLCHSEHHQSLFSNICESRFST